MQADQAFGSLALQPAEKAEAARQGMLAEEQSDPPALPRGVERQASRRLDSTVRPADQRTAWPPTVGREAAAAMDGHVR